MFKICRDSRLHLLSNCFVFYRWLWVVLRAWSGRHFDTFGVWYLAYSLSRPRVRAFVKSAILDICDAPIKYITLSLCAHIYMYSSVDVETIWRSSFGLPRDWNARCVEKESWLFILYHGTGYAMMSLREGRFCRVRTVFDIFFKAHQRKTSKRTSCWVSGSQLNIYASRTKV